MSTQRHLHRTAVFATASLVFAASATGTAFAWVRSDASPTKAPTTISITDDQNAARAAAQAAYIASVTIVPTASPTAEPTVQATPQATSTQTPAPVASATPAPSPARPKPAPKKIADTSGDVTISHYVDKPGSQAAIDKCNLVLWTHSPMWLAGHNWCGWQWMAYVPTGTTVTVTQGLAAGTYVVTGHKTLSRQSGALPSLTADLVLQTCVGDGTGLTLLKRTK